MTIMVPNGEGGEGVLQRHSHVQRRGSAPVLWSQPPDVWPSPEAVVVMDRGMQVVKGVAVLGAWVTLGFLYGLKCLSSRNFDDSFPAGGSFWEICGLASEGSQCMEGMEDAPRHHHHLQL